jgi:hypothetical protein
MEDGGREGRDKSARSGGAVGRAAKRNGKKKKKGGIPSTMIKTTIRRKHEMKLELEYGRHTGERRSRRGVKYSGISSAVFPKIRVQIPLHG